MGEKIDADLLTEALLMIGDQRRRALAHGRFLLSLPDHANPSAYPKAVRP